MTHQSTPLSVAGESMDERSYRCRVCHQSFPQQHLLILHRGVRHWSDLTEEERSQYRREYEHEEQQIRSFRIRALGVLVVLYFGFLFLYAIYAS